MPIDKVYTCCICHKVLDYKPHRLVHQEFGNRYNNGKLTHHHYIIKHNYDFCDKCFTAYLSWVKKYEEVKK